ncbi:MAG TPA: polysaccharide lyase [Myxococcales bacterium]|nr:polysaccharide lyase [Myxococcales bacterium]
MRTLALCAALCASTAASASVLWRGDFETGDLSQWSQIQQGAPGRLTIVQSPVRQGQYAMRVELHQGDVTNSGTRNELALAWTQYQEVEGNDRWYAWSTLFPPDYPSDDSWQVFTQWHQSAGCCGSPPVEFDVIGETIQMAHDGNPVWTAPLVRGVWHDFKLHVYWSATAGYVELWYDGQPALAKTAMQTLAAGAYNYLKQGLYRDAAITDVAVLYHDGFVIGTTQADLEPAPQDAGIEPPADGDAGSGDVAPPADPPAVPPAPAAHTSGLPGITGCASVGRGSLALLGLMALVTWRVRRRRTRRR